MHGAGEQAAAPAAADHNQPDRAYGSTPRPEASTDCLLPVYVAAPFYGPETFQAHFLLPCDPVDAPRQLARQLRQLALPFAGVVIEACPQPCTSCLVFVVRPEWLSYSGGSVVILDMRSTVQNGRGPLLAAFLSRPTDCSEIRREAGAFAIGACDIYVGNSATPLSAQEYITVPSGTTIRVSRTGPPRTGYLPLLSHFTCRRSPVLAGSLARISQPIRSYFCIILASFSLVVRPPLMCRFEMPSLGLLGLIMPMSPSTPPVMMGLPGPLTGGVFIRGVLAISERREPVDRRTILFLDLRQVGASFQFLCLEEPKISYAALEAALPRPPPPGWRLAVAGGRRYRNHLSVQHCDTVILGFVHQEDGAVDFSLSSSDDASSGDEDGEEENDTDDASVGSTRSPSRSLPQAGKGPSPSSDRSYKGDISGDTCGDLACTSAVAPSYSALPLDPLLFADPLPGLLSTPGSLSGPLWGHLCVKPAPSSWPRELLEHSLSVHLVRVCC